MRHWWTQLTKSLRRYWKREGRLLAMFEVAVREELCRWGVTRAMTRRLMESAKPRAWRVGRMMSGGHRLRVEEGWVGRGGMMRKKHWQLKRLKPWQRVQPALVRLRQVRFFALAHVFSFSLAHFFAVAHIKPVSFTYGTCEAP
jgi:hypothetical protein